MASLLPRIAAACSLCWLFGCAPTIQTAARDASKGAVPVAVSEGVKGLDQPETRARLLDLMGSPEMQQAIQDLAGAVVRGATQTLDSEQLAAKTAQLSSGIASLVTRAVVASALSEAASPVAAQRIDQIVSRAADTAARSSAHAFAEELTSTIGPALATAMQKDVAPSARALLDSPDVRTAMAQTAFEMSRQAVLGSNEALAELERKKDKSGTLARMSGWLANGGWLITIGSVAALLIIGTLFLILRRTRYLPAAKPV